MQRRSWRAAVGGGLLVFAATPCAVAQTPTLETIYYFQGEIDGKRPVGLTTGSDGVLYGVTSQGGTGTACRDGCGVVFSLTPPASASGAWTETVLYNFRGGRDGNSPVGLAANGSGVLYGTTFGGGDSGAGTVFSLTPPASSGGEWHKSVVYSFTGLPDGSGPIGGVSIDGGLIYGTTKFGGAAGPDCACGCGTVFSLTPPDSRGGAWAETVLYRFSGGSAGSGPGQHPRNRRRRDLRHHDLWWNVRWRYRLLPDAAVSPGGDWSEAELAGVDGADGLVLGRGGILMARANLAGHTLVAASTP